jgi:preprotein translocase subunit Sss1
LMLWTLLGSALIGAVGFVFALSGTSPQKDGILRLDFGHFE